MNYIYIRKMVILTQYHTEIQNRGISRIGASEIFPVSRMPRFQRLHCTSLNDPGMNSQMLAELESFTRNYQNVLIIPMIYPNDDEWIDTNSSDTRKNDKMSADAKYQEKSKSSKENL